MSNYRGANGWIHDGPNGEPTRYTNLEGTTGPRPKSKQDDASKPSKASDADVALAVCGLVAGSTIVELISTGTGYMVGGLGGLLIGLGVGAIPPVALVLYAVFSSFLKKGDESPSD